MTRLGRWSWALLVGLVLLVATAAVTLVWQRWSPFAAPSDRELAGLQAERDALETRFVQALSAGGDQGLAQAPRADVMIGVPTAFTERVAEEVVTGLLSEVRIMLRDIRLHFTESVKANLLFGRRATIGILNLDVHLQELRGVLRPGRPDLRFGQDRIQVQLPVSVAEGWGKADLRLKWDSTGLADFVCGDLDVTRQVEGRVLPATYQVAGAFSLKAQGAEVVLTPRFGDVELNVRVEPSKASWAAVDEIVASRNGACRTALGQVDVPGKLRGLLAKGLGIRLGKSLYRPVRLPAGVEQSLELQGVELAFYVKPVALRVVPERLWYGADVQLTRAGRSRP